MTIISSLKSRFSTIANNLNLPCAEHKADLDRDYKILSYYEGAEFIWLLREHGTMLLPLYLGVDPNYLTSYLNPNHFKDVHLYYVNGATGEIEKINRDYAEKLIFQTPATLDLTMSLDDVIATVDKVLANGKKLRLWQSFGTEEPKSDATWSDWKKYFTTKGNQVMVSFLDKGFRYAEKHKEVA